MQSAPPARPAGSSLRSPSHPIVRPSGSSLRLPTSPLSFVQRQLQPSHSVCARVDVHCGIQIELVAAVGNAVPQFRRQRIAQFITPENPIPLSSVVSIKRRCDEGKGCRTGQGSDATTQTGSNRHVLKTSVRTGECVPWTSVRKHSKVSRTYCKHFQSETDSDSDSDSHVSKWLRIVMC